jgi:hypothetical protein
MMERANLPLFPFLFSDQPASVVRNTVDGERALMMAGWGMTGPLQYRCAPVTNSQNVSSPHRARTI